MSTSTCNAASWNLFARSVRTAAADRWAGVLADVGIADVFLRNRHGPCPACGGADRFRFDNRNGTGSFVCSQGGGELLTGDGFTLIMHVLGCGFRTAVTRVGDLLDVVPPVGCGSPPWRVPRQQDHADLRVRAHGAVRVDHDHQAAVACERASRIWNSALPYAGHPYLERKGVQPHGTRLHGERIVVPLRDAGGQLHSLEFISADGTKRFLRGSRMRGCYFVVGEPAEVICIAEGFATAASVWQATGIATVCAFTAVNLKPVAGTVRAAFPGARIVLCADDDEAGRGMALDAARAVGGRVALPVMIGGVS